MKSRSRDCLAAKGLEFHFQYIFVSRLTKRPCVIGLNCMPSHLSILGFIYSKVLEKDAVILVLNKRQYFIILNNPSQYTIMY